MEYDPWSATLACIKAQLTALSSLSCCVCKSSSSSTYTETEELRFKASCGVLLKLIKVMFVTHHNSLSVFFNSNKCVSFLTKHLQNQLNYLRFLMSMFSSSLSVAQCITTTCWSVDNVTPLTGLCLCFTGLQRSWHPASIFTFQKLWTITKQ